MQEPVTTKEIQQFKSCTVEIHLSAEESILVPQSPQSWKSEFPYDIGDGQFRPPEVYLKTAELEISSSLQAELNKQKCEPQNALPLSLTLENVDLHILAKEQCQPHYIEISKPGESTCERRYSSLLAEMDESKPNKPILEEIEDAVASLGGDQ